MKKKFKVWLTIVVLGLIGVWSLVLSTIPLTGLPAEVLEAFSEEALRYFILINPAVFVLIATTVGILIYKKIGLSAPIIEGLFDKEKRNYSLKNILKKGIGLGLIAGASIMLLVTIFKPFLPTELANPGDLEMHILTRVLYGGITEEILFRFGLMTLIAWIIFIISKKKNSLVFWIAIILSALPFALGHLPIVFEMIEVPSLAVYIYIILANSVGGVLFGYAYWKHGLESAFIAHMFAHVSMVTISLITLYLF